MSSEELFAPSWPQLPQRGNHCVAPSTPARRALATAQHVPRTLSAPVRAQPGGWEYLDHTADVQIHAWGASIADAFAAAVVAMFAYMVELPEIPGEVERDVSVEGHDLESLLYNFMDECLYIFHTEAVAMKEVVVEHLDLKAFRIRAVGKGGRFDVAKHSQGTEVKAITYSNLQIVTDQAGKVDVYVIVDI